MKRAAIESLVIEPRMSMAMLGGTVSPIVAEAASTAAPSAALRRSRFSMSRITEPTAATSAALDPERPDEIHAQHHDLPAGRRADRPTDACTKRMRRKLMPPRSMMRPAKMKNGRASRMKFPVPLTMLLGNATIGTVSEVHG